MKFKGASSSAITPLVLDQMAEPLPYRINDFGGKGVVLEASESLLPKKEKMESCPRCGAVFACGVSQGLGTCWCMNFPSLPPQYRQGKGCYCPTCLKALTADGTDSPSANPA